jgi:hypothetical protein
MLFLLHFLNKINSLVRSLVKSPVNLLQCFNKIDSLVKIIFVPHADFNKIDSLVNIICMPHADFNNSDCTILAWSVVSHLYLVFLTEGSIC